MDRAPLILVLPSTDPKGPEFYDYSISLSGPYTEVILQAGGLPLIMPMTTSPAEIAQYVSRAQGIYLTGGDDIQPELYLSKCPARHRQTVGAVDPKRDFCETVAIQETFKQRKPLLAICRGHQILNVALGGTLIVDIPSQIDTNINHGQLVKKDQVVHKVALAEGSLMARVFGKRDIEVNSSHHQAILKLAEPLQVTGQSADGIIEATELRSEDSSLLPFLLSVQFHPERLVRQYPEFLKLFKSFVAAAAAKGMP